MEIIQFKPRKSHECSIFLSVGKDEIYDYLPEKKLIFLADEKVYQLHKNYFSKDIPLIRINAKEKNKSWQAAGEILGRLLEAGADSDSFLLGVGGGITTDICGFVASVYRRGISFGFLPTTLLAQADAAIGGKNAVNIPDTRGNFLKNCAGTINQPESIFICPEFLETLTESQYKSGFAEIIKMGLICDPEIINSLRKNDLHSAVRKSIRAKIGTIVKDVHHKNWRNILNFGHTLGHALESVSRKGKPLTHGEAVAIGSCFAIDVSCEKGILSDNKADEMKSIFNWFGLPVNCPKEIWRKAKNLISFDKKSINGKINFILLSGLAEPVIEEIGIKEVIAYVENLREHGKR